MNAPRESGRRHLAVLAAVCLCAGLAVTCAPRLASGAAPPSPALPAVTKLSPNSTRGASAGTVIIGGHNLSRTSEVRFGATSTPFTVLSDSTLRAVIPGGTGSVAVRVVNSAGTSVATPRGRFVYSSIASARLAPSTQATPAVKDLASAGSDCQPTTVPSATVDSSLDTLISNQLGPGWVGGDSTYSTALPGGREAFVFSDTLIGTAQASGTATLTGVVHNSELVGQMPELQSNYAGNYRSPESLIPDVLDSGDHWYALSTLVQNAQQLVFVNEYAAVPGSTNRFTGHSAIAVLTIPPDGMPVFASLSIIPTDASTIWGYAVTQDASYTYVYGQYTNRSTGKFVGMKVARVPLGETLDLADWQYWNGTLWVSGESNAVAMPKSGIFTGVTAQPSGGGYIAVAAATGAQGATDIDLSYACTPVGPWSTPIVWYAIPEISEYPNEYAYIPTFHPELSSAGQLVVSYDINNHGELSALEQDVHEYQPRFLVLG